MKNKILATIVLFTVILTGCTTNTTDTSSDTSESVSLQSEVTTEGEMTVETDTSLTEITETEAILETSETQQLTTLQLHPEIAEISRDDMYDDMCTALFDWWTTIYYGQKSGWNFLRETEDFNDKLMVELILSSNLMSQYSDFDTYGCFYYLKKDSSEDTCEFISRTIENIFGKTLSTDEVREILSDNMEGQCLWYFNEETQCVEEQDMSAGLFGFYDCTGDDPEGYVNYYEIVELTDEYFIVDFSFEYAVVSSNHGNNPSQDIVRLIVSVDWDESYDVGFQITNIEIEPLY